MADRANEKNNPLADLLVKIEIDAETWTKMTPREKLRYLKAVVKANSERIVNAAGGFVDAFSGLIRANTENPVVLAYLGLVETGLGLMRATAVANNVFISARHEIHSAFDGLARFMGTGRGVELITDSIEATPAICETFLGLTEKEQARYGFRFIKVQKVDEPDMADSPVSVFMVDAEMSFEGSKYHVGFEVGYPESKHRGDRIADEAGYSYINYGMHGSEYYGEALWSIPSKIYGMYIDRIDITKNIVRIKGGTLYVEPRVVVDFDVKNFDLYDEKGNPVRTMASESAFIRKVLDIGGRRGYIVQGDQGTGKTISVNRLLMDFPDVPVFWISPDSIADRRGMDNVFRVLDMFPGSFFVFDDFDGNDFASKNELTGAFINYIDETNSPKYRGITILIINEPQKLHSTIKLRPGRIDDIIYVKNPDTVEGVCDVVEQSFRHLGKEKPEWVTPGNPEFVAACELVFTAHLTHAYISGVVGDMVKFSEGDMSVGRFAELVARRIATIKYARMVARDDGHIVDGPPPAVLKAEPAKINSASPAREDSGDGIPM